jgi:N-acetylglucosamine kinase-like BadF-type ATPase
MELKRRANLLTRSELAALAPQIFSLAEDGCLAAQKLIEETAEDIASLAASVTGTGSEKKGILACGGMFQTSETFCKMCSRFLAKHRPEHKFKFLKSSGMIACAAIRALTLSGITNKKIIMKQLEREA